MLAGDAAAHPGLAPLRVGRPGSRTPGEAGAVAGAFPRRGLALLAMAPTGDAVVLERRGALVAVAARRIGAGRVMQVGYADSWRWRMEGDDEAPRRHRRWWSDVVAGVAHAPVVARATPATAEEPDPAPRAALVAALGEATAASEPDRAPTRRRRLSDSLLFAAATALLLAEWASRRLRGAR